MNARNGEKTESTVTATATDSTAWHTCEACGNWQQGGNLCTECQWPRMLTVEQTTARTANHLRVLIETEFRSDGSWQISGLRTARLQEFVEQADLVHMLSSEGARILGFNCVKGKSEFQIPTDHEWGKFRDHSCSMLGEAINNAIRRNWPAPKQPTLAQVVVSIRAYLLEQSVKPKTEEHPAWLQLIPFDDAAASTAAKLHACDIKIDCTRTHIGFTDGGDRIQASVTAPGELLINACELVSHSSSGSSRKLWSDAVTCVVRRNENTALRPITLSAEAVRGLASSSEGKSRGEFKVSVLGRDNAITADLPTVDLPPMDKVADLLLDLGSTNAKWALRLADGTVREHDQDTKSLAEGWGVDPYRKADFIADPTGAMWSEWASRSLPKLRLWVGSEQKTYLRHVYVSLPTTHSFDVGQLSNQLSNTAPVRDASLKAKQDRRISSLKDSCHENLVDNGLVVLMPEHRLLAVHYLTVLRILADAARAYASRFASHEERRRDQSYRRSAWDSQASAVQSFKGRSWWHRLWHSKPSGPSGSRPEVDHQIANPAKWMEDLTNHPEQLDLIVLLDAGGLSLDVSVLQKQELVSELSHSDDSCGGEEISGRIGRKDRGPVGTRYKAMLGNIWSDPRGRESSDAAQREYREVTREVYKPTLKVLFETLSKRWRRGSYCTVLLTGGGSRNPHFPDFVVELAVGAGFEVTVVDAPLVQDLITQARQFPEPLPQLESAPIKRFEETKRWSDSRERQPWARYDKFAVVGGMLAVLAGESQ